MMNVNIFGKYFGVVMKKRFSFFILLIFLTGCIGEYEDGPLISFKSHKSRLHGTWDVEYLIINGSDSTYFVKNQQCYQPMKFLSDDGALGGTTNLVPEDQSKCGLEGFYYLTEDNDNFKIFLHENTGYIPVGPFGLSIGAPEWEIIKLTSDKLWLEVTYKNMFCWMHLKKL